MEVKETVKKRYSLLIACVRYIILFLWLCRNNGIQKGEEEVGEGGRRAGGGGLFFYSFLLFNPFSRFSLLCIVTNLFTLPCINMSTSSLPPHRCSLSPEKKEGAVYPKKESASLKLSYISHSYLAPTHTSFFINSHFRW